ncbi:MAG TPA: hypothetical protein VMB76_21095 [Casimicrobiaceae bacterium]|jgi:hypothetical protein|nr:hypothetical protein [Casimicrobiaceae bacterium]
MSQVDQQSNRQAELLICDATTASELANEFSTLHTTCSRGACSALAQ